MNWATELLEHMWSSELSRFEATPSAEQDWFDHVVKMYEPFLLKTAQSWITGYNSNLDGHEYGNTRQHITEAGLNMRTDYDRKRRTDTRASTSIKAKRD